MDWETIIKKAMLFLFVQFVSQILQKILKLQGVYVAFIQLIMNYPLVVDCYYSTKIALKPPWILSLDILASIRPLL